MTTSTFTALCPGCFADKGLVNVCPHCGYDESQRRGPLVLPHRTLLNNGQYLIGKVLGKPGGFGITYLALDTKLETKVAIKEYLPRDLAGRDGDRATISAHSGDDAEHFRYGLTQFLQEARTLARFDHANIVRVRNFFEENGTGYLVMDYYDGITLADYLAQQPQGKLPEQTAIDILMPILDGLREVHTKNFLHRDIKPQNIYLTTGNRAILLDFGAARQALSERSRSLSVVLSEGYAPYEQYHRRGEQGPWTDIYASAAVLYHAVAGEPPPPATERVSKDELDIGALRVSASLANALRQGLAVGHKNRPQTMAEFQALLLGCNLPIRTLAMPVQQQPPISVYQQSPDLRDTVKSVEFTRHQTSKNKLFWWKTASVLMILLTVVIIGLSYEKKAVLLVSTAPSLKDQVLGDSQSRNEPGQIGPNKSVDERQKSIGRTESKANLTMVFGMLDNQIAYFESIFGPAKKIWNEERTYEIERCDIVVSVKDNAVRKITFKACNFSLYGYKKPLNQLKFRDFIDENTHGGKNYGHFEYDCFTMCGNGSNPDVHYVFGGSSVENFVTETVSGEFHDPCYTRLRKAIEKDENEDALLAMTFSASKYDDLAMTVCRDVAVHSYSIGFDPL